MFDSDRPDAYERVYAGLVARLAAADLEASAARLGLGWTDDTAQVPMFAGEFRVARSGVRAAGSLEPSVSQRIVLAHYLLHGGSGEAAGRFVPYRELPGGADFSRNLGITVEGRIAERFTGRAGELRRACEALGGRPHDPGVSTDAAFALDALPHLPMLLTFYDADEEFPAEAKLFYDANAPAFLDLECLAVLGMILAAELERVR